MFRAEGVSVVGVDGEQRVVVLHRHLHAQRLLHLGPRFVGQSGAGAAKEKSIEGFFSRQKKINRGCKQEMKNLKK